MPYYLSGTHIHTSDAYKLPVIRLVCGTRLRVFDLSVVQTLDKSKKYSIVIYLILHFRDLYITNSCINFFLYLGAGTKFRQDVKKLFKGKGLGREFTSLRSTTSSLKYTSSRESPHLSKNMSLPNTIVDAKNTEGVESNA